MPIDKDKFPKTYDKWNGKGAIENDIHSFAKIVAENEISMSELQPVPDGEIKYWPADGGWYYWLLDYYHYERLLNWKAHVSNGTNQEKFFEDWGGELGIELAPGTPASGGQPGALDKGEEFSNVSVSTRWKQFAERSFPCILRNLNLKRNPLSIGAFYDINATYSGGDTSNIQFGDWDFNGEQPSGISNTNAKIRVLLGIRKSAINRIPRADNTTSPFASLASWKHSLFFQIDSYETQLKNIAKCLRDYDKEVQNFIGGNIVLKPPVDLEEEAKYVDMFSQAIKSLINSMTPAASVKDHKKNLEEKLAATEEKQQTTKEEVEALEAELKYNYPDPNDPERAKLIEKLVNASTRLTNERYMIVSLQKQISDIYEGPEHKWGEGDNIVEIGIGAPSTNIYSSTPPPLKVIFTREHIAEGKFGPKLKNGSYPQSGAPLALGRYSNHTSQKPGVKATRYYDGYGPFVINEAVKRELTLKLLRRLHGHNNGFTQQAGDVLSPLGAHYK